MPDSQSPRLAVLVALLLAVIGVGLITSGVLMVFDGTGTAASPTTGADPTATTPSASVTTAAPATTVTTLGEPVVIAFVALSDATGTITLEAPTTWIDVDTGPWTSDGIDIGPSLSAAVDLQAWIEGWATPGMFVGVTAQLTANEAMGDFAESCQADRVEPITVAGAPGTAQWWWWCGEAASSFYVAVVTLPDGQVLLFQILDSPEALPVVVEHVLRSFRYTG